MYCYDIHVNHTHTSISSKKRNSPEIEVLVGKAKDPVLRAEFDLFFDSIATADIIVDRLAIALDNTQIGQRIAR